MDRHVKTRLLRLALDLTFLAGCTLFVFGVWMAWRPLGFIIGGIVIAAVAFFAGYKRLGNEGE